ncbi:peptidase M20 [Marivirga tractuosa]|uniref:Amidohydrolase n=1 Tax=Marivirga tractuosa (strain ATCC 23168 / DSM 4126 / NBRC 15989 / NCIMB 1408 / VKM B-1430 / H-43) TaxID=643867 RepID=E4TW11_MARTH|nr:amidohydrolase [Marivirga tractuosa]ADR23229.1 amidohydrolase [Marivirga tractuosa DSM 4126]BDD16097.1 peptidase M20 [Marivirga tractuosa]
MDLKLDIEELIELRHRLHANAEVSNQEEKTAKIIVEFLEQFEPHQIWVNVGGHGVIAQFKGTKEGENIGFRADLDALHIAETIDLEYASKTPHTAHKCGHDGHMTMVSGIAAYLQQNPLDKGNVYLVFQPAEETGEGAERINRSLKELDIKLDYLFGLHNLPDFPKGKILTKKGTFAAASRGMVIKLFGKTSHAAEPEYGISPVIAMAKITTEMSRIHRTLDFSDLTLATVIHSELGEIAFGTSPGYGEVRITLRAMKDEDMSILIDEAENLVHKYCEDDGLGCEISYTEVFPSTINSDEAYGIMQEAAALMDLEFKQLETPFKWSEDFGQYKLQYKTGFFGIGSGMDCPHLHDEFYDFPDEIIGDGVKMYIGLLRYFGLVA